MPQRNAIKVVRFVEFPHDRPRYWKRVLEALSKPIKDLASLKGAFFSITKYEYDVSLLEHVLNQVYTNQERQEFFDKTLPFMVGLIKEAPQLFTEFSLPILQAYENRTLKLSRRQVACILCNSFFSAFERPSDTDYWEEDQVCSINLDDLFCKDDNNNARIAKILMILNYFNRIPDELDTEMKGYVIFQRQFFEYEDLPQWDQSGKQLLNISIFPSGSIEDANDALQADFANMFIGGTVLSGGAVQEEIRMAICPEMIASRLFCERMHTTEAIIFRGVETFSKYKGYGSSLTYDGNYKDNNKDKDGNILTAVTAFDAMVFKNEPESQWEKSMIEREIIKAFVAFFEGKSTKSITSTSSDGTTTTTTNNNNTTDASSTVNADSTTSNDKLSPISTGNWGCGVFKGDRELKSLIQWIAASEAGRDIYYYTFGDKVLSDNLSKIVKAAQKKGIQVKDLYSALINVYAIFEKNPQRYSTSNMANPSTFKCINKLLYLGVDDLTYE